MATDRTVAVYPAAASAPGGYDATYTTLFAAEAAEDGDLTDAGGTRLIIEIVESDGSWSGAPDTTHVDWDGWTCDRASGEYIIVRTVGGARSADGLLDTTAYILQVDNNFCMDFDNDFDVGNSFLDVEIDGLQFVHDTGLNVVIQVNDSSSNRDVRLLNCYVQQTTANNGLQVNNAVHTIRIKSCIFNGVPASPHGIVAGGSSPTIFAHNNTIFGFDVGMEANAATWHAVNNAVFDTDAEDIKDVFTTEDYNATDNAGGTNNIDISPVGETEAVRWDEAFTDYTVSVDVTVTSGTSVLVNAGLNQAADAEIPSTDITGALRSTGTNPGTDSVTIGAFEFIDAVFSPAGVINGVSSTTLSLTVAKGIAGTINGVSSTTLTLTTAKGISGIINGVSSTTLALTTIKSIAGVINGVSSTTLALTTTKGISGTINGVSSTTCAISKDVSLVGTINGVSSTTLSLTVAKGIAGIINGVSSTTCTIGIGSVTLAGVINGVSSTACAITVNKWDAILTEFSPDLNPEFGGITLSNMTQGSVLFAGASGLVSQDNDGLFWNDANKRLGVGTGNPAAPLHVAVDLGDTSDTAYAPIITSRFFGAEDNARGGAIFSAFSSATGMDQLVIGVTGNAGNRNSPALYASARMVIQANGFVGVGTTNPLSLFHLAATSPTFRFEDTSGSGRTFVFQSFASVSPARFRIVDVDDSNAEVFAVVGGTGYIGFSEPNPETLFELTHAQPYITLHNSTHEDTDGGRESKLIFKGEQSGGEETELAVIEVSHDGTGDDQLGKFVLGVNTGSGVVDVVKIDSNRATKIGDVVTNYTQFAADGELTLAGTARVIISQDLEPSLATRPIANPPGEGTEDGFSTHDFNATTDESVYFHLELGHDYADAGLIHIHFDFFVDTAPASAESVVWGVEYKKQSIGDNFDFGTGTTTAYTQTSVTTGTPANDKKTHQSSEVSLVTTGFVAGDYILLRLFRDANGTGGTDDYPSDARVIDYHIEYLSDKLGEAT